MRPRPDPACKEVGCFILGLIFAGWLLGIVTAATLKMLAHFVSH